MRPLYTTLLAVIVLVGCDAADSDDDTDPPGTPASNVYNDTQIEADVFDAQGQPSARQVYFYNTNTNQQLSFTNSTNCPGREIIPIEINIGDNFRILSDGNFGSAFEYGSGAYFKFRSQDQSFTIILTERGTIGADFRNTSDRRQASINILRGFANRPIVCLS